MLFSQYKSSTDDLQVATSRLLTDSTLNAAFPNLVTLASLQIVLPVTTATVEHSFSDMKPVTIEVLARREHSRSSLVSRAGPSLLKLNNAPS